MPFGAGANGFSVDRRRNDFGADPRGNSMVGFGSSGIRGVVNEELTPQVVTEIAAAAGHTLAAERVAIGRDTRTSGTMLANAASAGFTAVGAAVDRLGSIPTPGLQAYCRRHRTFGCMVTGSHNPPRYNGIKLFDRDGIEVTGGTLETVETTLETGRYTPAGWRDIGAEHEINDACDRYVDEILQAVDRVNGLTVAVDPGHGPGGFVTPKLCRALGCSVTTINDEPDGTFPARSPEPRPAALSDLSRLVRAATADLGIAHDGDADRVVFVDETGVVVDGNELFAALAAERVTPGDVVVTAVNASTVLAEVVDDRGGHLDLTPIGSANIVARIRERHAAGDEVVLAGEANGGIFFPNERLARDGPFVAARMLATVAETPLSTMVAPYDVSMVRRRIEYGATASRDRIMDVIRSYACERDRPVDETDGIRIERADGWVLARPSGTEPIIRVVTEADDEETATCYADEIIDLVERELR